MVWLCSHNYCFCSSHFHVLWCGYSLVCNINVFSTTVNYFVFVFPSQLGDRGILFYNNLAAEPVGIIMILQYLQSELCIPMYLFSKEIFSKKLISRRSDVHCRLINFLIDFLFFVSLVNDVHQAQNDNPILILS